MMAGIAFSLALLSLSAALNRRTYSKVYALLVLMPLALLSFEILVQLKQTKVIQLHLSYLVSLSIQLFGGLLLTLGEPKHKGQTLQSFQEDLEIDHKL